MSHRCRFCSTPLETVMADLGSTPLANAFLEPTPEAIAAERNFPLAVMVCHACHLAQTTTDIPADAIFRHDYAYLSSFATSWLAHAAAYSEAMIGRFGLGATSKVVEIASNDGYLLRNFVARGIPCLGVEPASNAAALAIAQGVPTEIAFFGRASAARLAAEGHRADLMVANNVLAHVPDIRDFVEGFAIVLKPRGVATFEFPQLLTQIAGLQFDTIYHEHYSYLSLLAVETIFTACGLRVFDVERLTTHGGSLRVYAEAAAGDRPVTPAVIAQREAEREAGLHGREVYRRFAGRIAEVRDGFRRYLAEARKTGRQVVGYGAAAKGNTFLNVCGVTAGDMAYVVDRSDVKQGKLLPGSHIPVLHPDEIARTRPHDVVILPWNLADEITASLGFIRDWGGRFIVAVPSIRVL